MIVTLEDDEKTMDVNNIQIDVVPLYKFLLTFNPLRVFE